MKYISEWRKTVSGKIFKEWNLLFKSNFIRIRFYPKRTITISPNLIRSNSFYYFHVAFLFFEIELKF